MSKRKRPSTQLVNGEYKVDDLFRSQPKFAVINMDGNQDANAILLVKNLFDNGIKDVRFYDDLSFHPVVQQMIGRNGNGIFPSTSPGQTSSPIPLSTNPSSSSSSIHNFNASTIFPAFDPSAILSSLISSTTSPSPPTPPAPRKKQEPIPEEYVKCQLCETRLLITRYSYLANHVRKHCEVKAFQCTMCTFSSNAGNKVISHMKLQHSLDNVCPITRGIEEIQPILNDLMTKCYPNYQNQLAAVKNAHLQRNGKRTRTTQLVEPTVRSVLKSQTASQVVQPPQFTNLKSYRCGECSIRVNCVEGTETAADGSLVNHLRIHHTLRCMPYQCACGWKNATEWKVRRHICVRHPEKAADIIVNQLKTPDFKLFLHKYFIELGDEVPIDTEEIESEKIDLDRSFWNNLILKKRRIEKEAARIRANRDKQLTI